MLTEEYQFLSQEKALLWQTCLFNQRYTSNKTDWETGTNPSLKSYRSRLPCWKVKELKKNWKQVISQSLKTKTKGKTACKIRTKRLATHESLSPPWKIAKIRTKRRKNLHQWDNTLLSNLFSNCSCKRKEIKKKVMTLILMRKMYIRSQKGRINK